MKLKVQRAQRRLVPRVVAYLPEERVHRDVGQARVPLRSGTIDPRERMLHLASPGEDARYLDCGVRRALLDESVEVAPRPGVNPVVYLADVLVRVQTHPASRIDELLPHHWKPPAAEPSA